MSKSILIIDTPKNCDECSYCGKTIAVGKKRGKSFAEEGKRVCLFVKNYIFYGFDVESGRHECCPLKPLPKKLSEKLYDDMDRYEVSEYAIGWNDCLDEILGGEKE